MFSHNNHVQCVCVCVIVELVQLHWPKSLWETFSADCNLFREHQPCVTVNLRGEQCMWSHINTAQQISQEMPLFAETVGEEMRALLLTKSELKWQTQMTGPYAAADLLGSSRVSQMCGGGTAGEITRPILLKLSSVCAHLACCVNVLSWLERGIQLSKLVLCWCACRRTEGSQNRYDGNTWGL